MVVGNYEWLQKKDFSKKNVDILEYSDKVIAEVKDLGYSIREYDLDINFSFISKKIGEAIITRENNKNNKLDSIDTLILRNQVFESHKDEDLYIKLKSEKELKHFLRNMKLHETIPYHLKKGDFSIGLFATTPLGVSVGYAAHSVVGNTLLNSSLSEEVINGLGITSFFTLPALGFVGGLLAGQAIFYNVDNLRYEKVEKDYKNYKGRMVFGNAVDLAKQYI